MKIGKTNIYTWATYKKKFDVKLMQSQDSTLGFRSVIKPTMLSAGFKHTDFELKTGCDAKELNGSYLDIIKANLAELKATYIVYHVWSHSRGYCKYLDIYYC